MCGGGRKTRHIVKIEDIEFLIIPQLKAYYEVTMYDHIYSNLRYHVLNVGSCEDLFVNCIYEILLLQI
jgi:uncharacterized protein YutD